MRGEWDGRGGEDMVWVDTDGLSVVGRQLGVLRDDLLPTDVPDQPGSDVIGAADLAAAIGDYITAVRRCRIGAAREVDTLATGATAAAAGWAELDAAAAARMRALQTWRPR